MFRTLFTDSFLMRVSRHMMDHVISYFKNQITGSFIFGLFKK